MKKFQILIFGASTTHGNWDELGGWSDRIRQYVIKKVLAFPDKFQGHVFNLGVPGDTANILLKRMEPEIKARLFYPETIIIISVGTNDSRITFADKKNIISDKDFETAQDKILETAKKYTNKILYVGLTPVDEKRTNPWGKYAYLNSRIKKFNKIIKSVCLKNEVEFLDLFGLFKSDDFTKDIYDGLHPNSSGHRKIFHLTQPYIDKFLQ